MDLPAPAPSQCVMGMTIELPEPWASQVRIVRSASGDPLASSVPPHVTLLPPTVVERDDVPVIVDHVERVVAGTRPFVVRAHGVGTFRPVSPVVYLALAAGADRCDSLQRDLRGPEGSLFAALRFPFHPHVTLAQDVADDALDGAARDGALIDANFVVEQICLHRLADDGTWERVSAPVLRGAHASAPRSGGTQS